MKKTIKINNEKKKIFENRKEINNLFKTYSPFDFEDELNLKKKILKKILKNKNCLKNQLEILRETIRKKSMKKFMFHKTNFSIWKYLLIFFLGIIIGAFSNS